MLRVVKWGTLWGCVRFRREKTEEGTGMRKEGKQFKDKQKKTKRHEIIIRKIGIKERKGKKKEKSEHKKRERMRKRSKNK